MVLNYALPIATSLRGDGHYKIEKVLGAGGFGITYQASDALGRHVAIKEFFPVNFCYRENLGVCKRLGNTGVFDFDQYRDDFFDEAKTLVQFNHPNIVRIFDAFTGNNTAYFVMEFEEGQTLQDLLATKLYLTESETIKYMKEIGQALEYIHGRQTLHRDVKPSNIIIRRNGAPVLIDFGAARQLVHGNEEHTAILSHGFAPPEQYDESGRKGAFIDVYGLSATCYCCVTGTTPLRADVRTEQVIAEPNSINPAVSEELNRIIMKGMELDSANRYPTISNFLYDLTSVSVNEETDHSLNSSQQECLSMLSHFIDDNETNVFIIKGATSTGKTTLIKKVLSGQKANMPIKLFAVGSRVAEQLMINSGLEAYSLYRHIYNFNNSADDSQSETIDLEHSEISEATLGKTQYSIKNNTDGDEVIYIVEEGQLLSDSFSENELFIFGSGKLLNDLVNFIDAKKHLHRKLIIVGDDYRLSRGSNDESSLSKAHLANTYQLNSKEFELPEIILNEQQKKILETTKELCVAIAERRFNKLLLKKDDVSIFKLEPEEFVSYYQKLDSLNQSIFLTYSNKHSMDANLIIRRDLLGRNDLLEKGDIITFNNTVAVLGPHRSLFPTQIFKGEIAEVIAAGDQELKTVHIKGKPTVNLLFRKIRVFIPRYHREEQVVILENYLRQEKDISPEERIGLLILARNNFKNEFGKTKTSSREFREYLKRDPYYNVALIKYGYAMTCHKANGARWKNVFINCETDKGKDNDEYFRWLYTAMSCAKSKIYLIGFNEITPFVKLEWTEKLDSFDRYGRPQIDILSDTLDQEIPEDLKGEVLKLKFPAQFKTLPIIWYLITSKLSPFQIRVIQVEHHTYQELYSFADADGNKAKIRFHYNSEGRITRPMLVPKNEFSERVLKLLTSGESANIDTNFSSLLLKDLYERLRVIAHGNQIEIKSLDHELYHERYLLMRNEEFIQFSVFYNNDGFVTTFVPTKFNSHTLYQKVKELVTTNLRLGNA